MRGLIMWLAVVLLAGEADASPRYTGRKVSIDLRAVDTRQVLRILGDVARLDVVMTDDVGGPVDIEARDAPWDEVMAAVLEADGLGSVRVGRVLFVCKADEVEGARRRLQARTRGARIDVELKDARLAAALALFEAADHPVAIEGAAADGAVTLSLHGAPIEQAVALVLASAKLDAGAGVRASGRRGPTSGRAARSIAPDLPLGDLTVTGTLTAGRRSFAVLERPDGGAVVAVPGDRVGRDGARVRRIRRDEVRLELSAP